MLSRNRSLSFISSLVFVFSIFVSATVFSQPAWKSGGSTDSGGTTTSGGGKTVKGKAGTFSEVIISEYPVSIVVKEKENATFLVKASSSDGQLISYQWLFNGAEILGATGSTYTIYNASAINQGQYTVAVRTPDRSKTASAALTVEAVPDPVQQVSISLQPVSQTVYVNDSVTLNVSATGTGPLNYQWRKNGVALSGQTASYLTIANITLADSAVYDVVVSNEAGEVPSSEAVLSVKAFPSLALSWDTPNAREDGSALALSDIGGYKVYISYEGVMPEEVITVPATLNVLELNDMPPGNYSFSIATTDSAGVTGNRSDALTMMLN